MNSRLVDLARQGSSDKRRELLQQVSDLFVDGASGHTDREAMLFGDVLSRLLGQVPVADRVALAERVAPLDRTPHDLAVRLANDESEVAAPVLKHSPVLTDDDLIAVARSKGQDHLKAISMRVTLSSQVTDVIVTRGDEDVLTTVARNAGASFSETGFATLVEKAGDGGPSYEALAMRQDLPQGLAAALMARLDAEGRQRLTQLMEGGNQEQLEKLLGRAKREVDQSRGDNRRNRLETKILIVDVREGKRSVDDALDHLVLNRRMLDIAYLLAELAGVPEAHVNNVLHKVNGMGIAVVCRSLDLSETVYGRLARLRCERLKLNSAQVEPMLREYQGVDKQTAERTLRFHKVRSSVARAG